MGYVFPREETSAGTSAGRPFDAAVAGGPPPLEQASSIGWLAFWMSGTLISFIVAALSVRALGQTLGAFEIMSIRSAGGLLILVVLGLLRPELRANVTTRHMGLQTVRNLVHFGSQVAWTFAIMALPLATVFALEFTIPAWVALLAVLFLGERMTSVRGASLFVCFVGVVIILRPGLESFQPAALLMVVAALFFAIAAIITKKLVQTETTYSILLWMNLMQLPLNMLGSDPLFVFKLDAQAMWPALGIAVAGLSVHYCLTNAMRYGDAMIVIPMDFLRVPAIAVIGWMFYGEHLDAFVFGGAGLIVAGVLWNLRGETQRNSRLAALRPPARPIIQPAE